MKLTRDLLRRVYAEVRQIEDHAFARVLPALRVAEAELDQALKGMMVGDLGETFTRAVVRTQLAQLKKAREAYRRVSPEMYHSLAQGWRESRTMSLQRLRREADAGLREGEFATEIDSQVALFAAEHLSSGLSARVPRFDSSVRRYGDNVWADVSKQLQVSILKGDTVFEATNRLIGSRSFIKAMSRSDSIGEVMVKGSKGLGAKYRYWGERVVRTETMSAYNAVHDESIRGLDAQLSQAGLGRLRRIWDATMDRRVCLDCAARDGKEIEGSDVPPLHPFCRCVVVSELVKE